MAAAEQYADDVEIDREYCQRGLLQYMRTCWHLVEPARPFQEGWHHGALAEHLEAVSAKEILRLVINIPPNTSKSLTACVFWPTWQWGPGGVPDFKWIFGTYSDRLSRRDALKARRVLESDFYRDRWGHLFKPRSGDEWTAMRYANDQGGFRISTSISGQITGDHADCQVVDDPVKPMDVLRSTAAAATALDKAKIWWNETMATRLVDFEKSARVIIMQRVHEEDLAGHVLKDEGYDHLCLPMEYDPKTVVVSGIGFEDPRKEDGELLQPERFGPEAVARLKKELGSMGAAAQLQQLPAPRGGAIFKRAWIRYYYRKGWEHLRSDDCVPLPAKFDQELLSFDCAFKGGEKHQGSKVGGAALGKREANTYLLDRLCESLDMPGTVQAVKTLAAAHPRAFAKLIEDAANGPAVYATLNSSIPGMILVPTGGGKVARANAVAPIVEGGNFYIPHPEMTPWSADFETNLCTFPSGSIDDDVDAVTHGLVRLHLGESERYIQAMQKLKGNR